MLDREPDITDNEMADFWWSRLTDTERAAWLRVRTMGMCGHYISGRWRRRRAEVCSLATGHCVAMMERRRHRGRCVVLRPSYRTAINLRATGGGE